MQAITREQVEALDVGTMVSTTFDTRHGEVLPGARWSEPYPITRVHARGDDVNGNAYVCFYRKWGSENSTMSGSMKEGDVDWRIVG